jgi:hypothetical protein
MRPEFNVSKALSIFLILGVVFCQLPGPLRAQAVERGNLIGFIFDRDGTTPVPGAVAKLKNISSGAIYVSGETDRTGAFRVDGLSKGIYTYGITTPGGDFNSNELIGILANETTKISISLNTYDTVVQSAVQEVLRLQQADPNGETRVGRVVSYNPSTKEALVFVEKGVLSVSDNVRVLGVATNFKQDVSSLVLGKASVKRALAGQEAWMKVGKPAAPQDAVYLTCKTGTPFFLTPCGIAWVVAGTGAVFAGIITTTDPDPVSPFTVKK